MNISRRAFIKLMIAGVVTAKVLSPAKIFAAVKEAQKNKEIYMPGAGNAGEFLVQRSGNVLIAGNPAEWWADKFGLPLSINYAPSISKNIRDFKNIFTKYYPKGEIRYAVKANTHPAIMSLCRKEGIGADVASKNEMRCALEAKIDSQHLDVNGNSKTEELINMALNKNMLIVADSIEEFLLISKMAKNHMVKPRVVLRLAGYDLKNATAESMFTAGKWCKFGADIEDLPHFYSLLPKHPHIDFLGFHTHIGSQITSVEPYRIVLGKLIEFSETLNKKGGNCRLINIGGGFPVSYYRKKGQWDEELKRIRDGYALAQRGDDSKAWVWSGGPAMFMDPSTGIINLNEWSGEKSYSRYHQHLMLEAILAGNVTVFGKTMSTVKALKNTGEPVIVIEPGRSIAETSGISLIRVKGVRKVNGDHNLVTLDAGAVNFADAMEKDYLMRRWTLVSEINKPGTKPFDAFLAGRLCYNGDIIRRLKIRFPRAPRKGDIVMVYDTGAYSPHFYAANTNSFPRPARVMSYENGSVEFLRKVDSYDEIFSL